MMRAEMDQTGTDIRWKEWSESSFEEARRQGKLVLLDLTASWCHWCHVMDERTYSNAEIASAVNEQFIPIRVDIDKRPDISERYNRGGFPTTAFLSDRGESIWGATFVPPIDMKRIMEAILTAKRSGEIDRALERSRILPEESVRSGSEREPVTEDRLSKLFEDMLVAYDVEFGGFGLEPKFPHPDAIELLLTRSLETKDSSLLDAAVNTLERMVAGLHDDVEGGVFRYSVTRDWSTPHYEKMLETNLGFLRNLIHAHGIVGNRGFDVLAKSIGGYLLATLHDGLNGGFFGSQDADEEYYRLGSAGRRARCAPSVDKTVYGGWNAEASHTFVLAGTILHDEKMIDAARRSLDYALDHLWNRELGLMRHIASEETYLFEDQVSLLGALLAHIGLSKDSSRLELIDRLIHGVDGAFASREGGYNDVMLAENAIGELVTPRRSLVDNSNWALGLARFGAVVHREDLANRAREILDAFSFPEVEAHGIFVAAYIRTRRALDRGIREVQIHTNDISGGAERALLESSIALPDPSVMVTTIAGDEHIEPFATICSDRGCSGRITQPGELLMRLRDDD